jgi:hypothetical protein
MSAGYHQEQGERYGADSESSEKFTPILHFDFEILFSKSLKNKFLLF